MNNAVTHLLYDKNFKYYILGLRAGSNSKVGAKKFQIDIFLLLPATRFHKVKIESPRWKSSIKVYTSTIPRFIFQWQLASDMIKDVFTLEQKVK